MPDVTTYTFRLNGHGLERLPLVAESLDAASARLPAGVYSTLRTYQGRKILRLRDHVQRLERSARALQPERPITIDSDGLRRALTEVFDRTGFRDSRLRITLGLPSGDLLISVQEFEGLDPELYERGVAAATCPFVEHDVQAKSTASISRMRQAQASLPAWAHEGILLDAQGRMLEGLSSNFYAVRDGVIYTAGEGVVAGNVRLAVLDLAAEHMPVVLEAVGLADIPAVSECFLTSASREVLPVVRVDDLTVGDGRPGPVARDLLARFRQLIRDSAEQL